MRAFQVAMKLRKDVIAQDNSWISTQKRDNNLDFVRTEDLFEKLHYANEESWLRHTDFISEAEGLHGTIDKRLCKVDDIELEFFRCKATLKNQQLENFEQMFISENKNDFNMCIDLKIVEYDGVWPSVVY